MIQMEKCIDNFLHVSNIVSLVFTLLVLVCQFMDYQYSSQLLIVKEAMDQGFAYLKKKQDKEDELKLEFMNYFVKGRLPPSRVIEKLKLNDLWIHMRLYAVPEGKAKCLREGGIFYDYNKVKECFLGSYDKTKLKVENNREFKFCQQPFDTSDTKKNLLETIKTMEKFIDDGGNRSKPKKKRSKTPKRLKDD
jgi:hypothetical protein